MQSPILTQTSAEQQHSFFKTAAISANQKNEQRTEVKIVQQSRLKTLSTPALQKSRKRRRFQKSSTDDIDLQLKEVKLQYYLEQVWFYDCLSTKIILQVELCKLQKQFFVAKTDAAYAIASLSQAKRKLLELDYKERMRYAEQTFVNDPNAHLNVE